MGDLWRTKSLSETSELHQEKRHPTLPLGGALLPTGSSDGTGSAGHRRTQPLKGQLLTMSALTEPGHRRPAPQSQVEPRDLKRNTGCSALPLAGWPLSCDLSSSIKRIGSCCLNLNCNMVKQIWAILVYAL